MSAPRFRFCDDLGDAGLGWVAEEPLARASHALASDGRVWLVDPLEWAPALERALELGEPAAVVQLLDRHNRDCAALAGRLGVPHVVVPTSLPESPFESVPLVRRRLWRESALWWPQERVLVVADALGSNRLYTGGTAPVGVHVLLRLTPPRALGHHDAEHLLVGHGEGLHGSGTATAVARALARSRRDLPGVLLRLPFVRKDP